MVDPVQYIYSLLLNTPYYSILLHNARQIVKNKSFYQHNLWNIKILGMLNFKKSFWNQDEEYDNFFPWSRKFLDKILLNWCNVKDAFRYWQKWTEKFVVGWIKCRNLERYKLACTMLQIASILWIQRPKYFIILN